MNTLVVTATVQTLQSVHLAGMENPMKTNTYRGNKAFACKNVHLDSLLMEHGPKNVCSVT